jgi:hypothetical protein
VGQSGDIKMNFMLISKMLTYLHDKMQEKQLFSLEKQSLGKNQKSPYILKGFDSNLKLFFTTVL